MRLLQHLDHRTWRRLGNGLTHFRTVRPDVLERAGRAAMALALQEVAAGHDLVRHRDRRRPVTEYNGCLA